jgi:hypothetical protein
MFLYITQKLGRIGKYGVLFLHVKESGEKALGLRRADFCIDEYFSRIPDGLEETCVQESSKGAHGPRDNKRPRSKIPSKGAQDRRPKKIQHTIKHSQGRKAASSSSSSSTRKDEGTRERTGDETSDEDESNPGIISGPQIGKGNGKSIEESDGDDSALSNDDSWYH